MTKLSFLPLLCAVMSLSQEGAQAQQSVPPRARPNGLPVRPGAPGGGPQLNQTMRPPLPGQPVRPVGVPAGTTGTPASPVRPGVSPAPTRNAVTPAPDAPPPSGKNVISFIAAPLSDVVEEYYRVTKRRVLKDRGLENATVSIEVPGEFNDEEYQSIIEKGLLMHGFALVPSGPNLFKLVAAEQGTTPSTQGVPVILRAEDLPQSDQVVSHVIQLNYLQAEEASSALQQLVPLHPYGKILAMDNARALVITEASQTIRAYLDLTKQVDVAPMDTMQKTFVLQRSTASEVAEQLSSLLGLGSSGGAATTGSTAPRSAPARPVTNAPVQPGMLPPAAGVAPTTGGTSASLGGGVSPESSKPVIQAIERNNSLIVIARPTDMVRIENLIHELDAESTNRRYFSRRLNYLDLTVFLGIAEKALQRNSKAGGQSSLPTQEGARTTPTTNNFGSNNNGSSFGSGMSSGLGGGGFGGGGLGGGGSSGFGSSSGAQLDITKKPVSVLIGHTLVIADPASSKFFASGPPDQIQALEELADELDVRPRQIYINAIIGEFTITDQFNFGINWINALRQTGDSSLVGGVLNTQGTVFNPNNLQDIASALALVGPTGVGGFTAYGQINRNLGLFLNTLERSDKFRVLQKPTLTAMNHQPATIYIGQQIAIAGQTFTNGNNGNNGLGFTSTTQYIPVRLQIDITPHIFNDNEVMLEFKQQNNGISGTSKVNGAEVPNISEQGMMNSLIVGNNSTAMLGGLITESNKNGKGGLPFLVRIPVLKHLFGSTDKEKIRREMMIFVQPTIIPDNQSHQLMQAKLGDHVQNFDDTGSFAGRPTDPIPRALPVDEPPPVIVLPPAAIIESKTIETKTIETKKSFFGKVKSLFTRD